MDEKELELEEIIKEFGGAAMEQPEENSQETLQEETQEEPQEETQEAPQEEEEELEDFDEDAFLLGSTTDRNRKSSCSRPVA